MDYRDKNQALLNACLEHLTHWVPDIQTQKGLNQAFRKALKVDTPYPSPPLFSWLLADDLGHQEAPWAFGLAMACAYFYTSADLLDDIQDQDPKQPVLQTMSPFQAMNLCNLLLMGAYRVMQETDLSAERKLALSQLFTHMGGVMSQGQFWDLAYTNSLTQERDPEQIARAKAGAEFGGFLSIVPCALGENPDDYFRFGEILGVFVQILSDYFDIWIVPHQQALSQDLWVLKNSFPLFWARQDARLGPLLDMALAGKNNVPAKQFQIRRMMAQTQTIAKFEELVQKVQHEFAELFASLPPMPSFKAICETYLEQANQLIIGLKSLNALTQSKTWQPYRDLPKAMQMAIDNLNSMPDFKDVWEVQRWGFLGEATLYGDIFNPALVLEALAICGQNIETPLRALLEKSAPDGWHYFSNSLKIPTDTDDLGQLLQLSTLLPRSEVTHFFKYPLELLQANLDDSGKCPTWLADEVNFQREMVNKTWFGNECLAVMANLYYGLACYDLKCFRPEIERGMYYLLSQYQSEPFGWKGVYYDSLHYTSYLVCRLLRKGGVEFEVKPLIESLISSQALDGGWFDANWQSSPQECAFAILMLCELKSDSDWSTQERKCILRATAYLIEHQLYDGSWIGENLFVRPGKEAIYEKFAHTKLTTAFCLRALKAAEPFITGS